MQITLLVFLQGCVQVEYNLSNSMESLLTSVVFGGILFFMTIIGILLTLFNLILFLFILI